MSTMTGIFKRKPHPTPQRRVEYHHDPANMAIPEPPVTEEVIGGPEPHQPMMYKLPTSQHQLYTVNGMKYFDRMFKDGKLDKPEYFIKPGWIVTN